MGIPYCHADSIAVLFCQVSCTSKCQVAPVGDGKQHHVTKRKAHKLFPSTFENARGCRTATSIFMNPPL